jgi:hypothetical protein
LGLFGQLRDFGESRDCASLWAVEFRGAKGAVGLESTEFLDGAVVGTLGASLIAGEAIEEVGRLGVGEIVLGAEGDFGFDAAEALEIPGGVEDLAKGDGFEGTLGVEIGFEGVTESREFFLVIRADDEVFGGESMFEGVLSDAGFSFGRDRPGGELRIGAVGGQLSCCSHD